MEPDYVGAALRAYERERVLTASFENGCRAHACCICWVAIREGEECVPVYEDIYRPAHVSCIKTEGLKRGDNYKSSKRRK
jgi:hypothetical protein